MGKYYYDKNHMNHFAEKLGLDLSDTNAIASMFGVEDSVLENIVVNKNVPGVYSDWQSLEHPGERAMLLVIILYRKQISSTMITNFLGNHDEILDKVLKLLAKHGDTTKYNIDFTKHYLFGDSLDLLLTEMYNNPEVMFEFAGMLLELSPSFIEDNFEAGLAETGRSMAVVTFLSAVIMTSLIWYVFKVIAPPVAETRFYIRTGMGSIQSNHHIDLRGLSKKKALTKLKAQLALWRATVYRVAIDCGQSSDLSAAVANWVEKTPGISFYSTARTTQFSTVIKAFGAAYVAIVIAIGLQSLIGLRSLLSGYWLSCVTIMVLSTITVFSIYWIKHRRPQYVL